MKKYLTFLLFSLMSTLLYAQKENLKVGYDYHYYSARGSEINRPMILTLSNSNSKFYNRITEYVDSVCSTPEGQAEYNAYVSSINWSKDNDKPKLIRWEKMYVEKDRANNKMTVYDTVAGEDFYCYDEELGCINWELTDSVADFLGYSCNMAECDYHGRHWTVWYTTEIPVSEGPWKLHGLPGLILKAEETEGRYTFTATGLERYEKDIEPVYQKNIYEKIDRIELYKTKSLVDGNFGGYVSARTGTSHPADMKSTKMKKGFDYIETDYR